MTKDEDGSASSQRGVLVLGGLFLTGLAFGVDDVVVAGLSPGITRDLGVSSSAVGQLVTVFAVVYAAAAPLSAAAFGRVPRRLVLAVASTVFVVVSVASAAAPSYGVLMGLRVVAAACAGAVTPTLVTAALTAVPASRQGRAVVAATAGFPVALAVGVPVGAWLTGTVSWRVVLLAIAVLAAVATGVVVLTAPAGAHAPGVDLRRRLRLLRQGTVFRHLALSCSVMAAQMAVYPYIAPVTSALTSGGTASLVVVFAATGAASVVGLAAGGTLADRWGTGRTLAVAIGGIVAMVIFLTALSVFVPQGELPLAAFAGVTFLWGAAAFGQVAPVSVRLSRMAGEAATDALAWNTTGGYLGTGIGAAAGGLALRLGGVTALLVVACFFALAALAQLRGTIRRGGHGAVTASEGQNVEGAADANR